MFKLYFLQPLPPTTFRPIANTKILPVHLSNTRFQFSLKTGIIGFAKFDIKNVETTEPLIKANDFKSTDILRTLRQVSLIFFLLLGSTHIISGLLASENMFLPLSNLINRILDIPFIIVGVVYGLSHTKLETDSAFKKPYLIIMTIITLLVLGGLLYINVFLPDKPL